MCKKHKVKAEDFNVVTIQVDSTIIAAGVVTNVKQGIIS
jgi:hypothetical protein